MEVLLLRRIYRAPELFQLLATFGVVLVVQDLVIQVFGPQDILGPARAGAARAGRNPRPALPVLRARADRRRARWCSALLWLLLRKTRFGVLVRAATQDREMVAALGVNQALLFTGTLFLGAFLAGLGGALQIPQRRRPIAGMDLVDHRREPSSSPWSAAWAACRARSWRRSIIGQLQAFGILIFPKITLVRGVPADGAGAGGAALRLVRPARGVGGAHAVGDRQPAAALRRGRERSRSRRLAVLAGCCRWSATPTS